ncbi:MAG: DUF3231 family protein [Bacillota bacterium]
MISIFKRNSSGRDVIDVSEGYNIWVIVSLRYYYIETFQIMRNFVHDRDLAIVVNSLVDLFNEQKIVLESQAAKHVVRLPARPSVEAKTASRMDVITDYLVYNQAFQLTKYDLIMLGYSIRTSTTNDSIRENFEAFAIKGIGFHNQLQKYGKLKGYQDPPPSFKTSKPVDREEISLGEAFQLWDFLSHRYDQMQLTTLFLSLSHDPDFVLVLEQGLKLLQKQIALLEGLAAQQEILLPKRPPLGMKTRIDPENLTDKFLYRMILQGIQAAIDMHMRPVIDAPKNDKLAETFINLLLEEIKIHNKFVLYGKAKGWLNQPPLMVMPT